MAVPYDLELDRLWLTRPRAFYLYRGDAELSEVYILRTAIGEDPPTRVRLWLGSQAGAAGVGQAFLLELDRAMLGRVASKYLYRSQEKEGSYHIISGVYVERAVLGDSPPDVLPCSLEWRPE